MKNLKKLFTALLLLCVTAAFAHDFEVGGIYYNIINEENKTVEVTFKGSDYYSYNNDEYSGDVVIPETVTYNDVTYNITSIGLRAFSDCFGLTSIELPNSVTSIGSSAFYHCYGLTSIVIPNSVTSIGDKAFYGCSGLTSIEIPNSVTSIGIHAFNNCRSLTSITSLIPAHKLFALARTPFYGVDKAKCTLYVPYGAKETYAATDGWKEIMNIVELK